MKKSVKLEITQAKALWISAQGLHQKAWFGSGASATARTIEHLGYVQIDTINVIERCHHHILYSRIPNYHQNHLHKAQSEDKTIFEYWTHALSYVPTKDFRYFQIRMRMHIESPHSWYESVTGQDLQKILRLIKKNGAISIREITDDVLVAKDHEWASRKPSKKALELAFHQGKLVISERVGMLKKYALAEQHFNWAKKPKAATESEVNDYLIERSLRSQSVVSLDSICYLKPSRKPAVHELIQNQVQSGKLVPVHLQGFEKIQHWMRPELLQAKLEIDDQRAHILSPFDPLIIQRKRLNLFFDYQHLFEAYIPKEKRIYGYFSLPVLVGDKIVALLDLKTNRESKKLLVQKWTWLPRRKSSHCKELIETELHRFEAFQLQN